jgi:hypothetical protein
MKLSKSMIKCINEMKETAIELFKDIPIMQFLKITHNVTKHKEFEFHILNLGKPAIKLFINGKFYKSYLYSKGVWTED